MYKKDCGLYQHLAVELPALSQDGFLGSQ